MSSTSPTHHDPWPYEREGYSDTTNLKLRLNAEGRRHSGLRLEERLGNLLGISGIIWAFYVMTKDANPEQLMQTPGPLELCAVALLLWMHTKWRSH